jgi:hypothetical protein
MWFRTAIEFCERWLGRWHLMEWLYEKKYEVVGAAMTVGAAALRFWDEIRQLNPAWIILILAAAFALVMVGINQGLRFFDRRRSGRATQSNISNRVVAKEIGPHQQPERTPLLDIVAMAKKAGWDTDLVQSNDASELTDRLNQAAADRTIKFWGRKYKYDLAEAASTTFPLIEIPAEHFAEFSFQPLNLFRDRQTNFYISTGKLGSQPRELRGSVYQDIHACRDQLVEWMNQNTKIGRANNDDTPPAVGTHA